MTARNLQVELKQEDDGRWIADVVDLPGVLSYGATQEEALARVQALARRVLEEREQLRAEYDFHALRVVARGPGRRRKGSTVVRRSGHDA